MYTLWSNNFVLQRTYSTDELSCVRNGQQNPILHRYKGHGFASSVRRGVSANVSVLWLEESCIAESHYRWILFVGTAADSSVVRRLCDEDRNGGYRYESDR